MRTGQFFLKYPFGVQDPRAIYEGFPQPMLSTPFGQLWARVHIDLCNTLTHANRNVQSVYWNWWAALMVVFTFSISLVVCDKNL